jgi:hypothetical protein
MQKEMIPVAGSIDTQRAQALVLLTHRLEVTLKVNGALGEATMSAAVYGPILDLLADHQARTLGEIAQAVEAKGVAFGQVVEAALVLAGSGHVATVQDGQIVDKAKKHTDKLNAYLLDKARGSGEIGYLASPVTGGGVALGRAEQLFLGALSDGKMRPSELAAQVWQILAAQDQKLVKEGRTRESAEENLAELAAQVRVFIEKRLPILKAAGIA